MDYRLDTISLAVSQHYKLLKSIVTSSSEFRLLTKEEAQLADYLADVIERVSGKRLALYCRDKFQKGWMNRDLRSYKIKFVLTKLRDMLKKDGPVRQELVERLEELTSRAEFLAGCTADNKRRNKKAREERERQKAEKEKSKDSNYQMDLFEYAESQSSESHTAKEEAVGAVGSGEEDEDLEDLEDLEDVSLEFRLSKGLKSSERKSPSERNESPEEAKETKAKAKNKKKDKKKSAKERKYERMTQDILRSEYGDDDDDNGDNGEDDKNEEEPEYEYGKHFGDISSVYGCDDGDNW